MSAETTLGAGDCAVVLGLGITGSSVCRALVARGIRVVAIEDRPTDTTRLAVLDLAVDLIESPSAEMLDEALEGAKAFLPSPGVPETHPAFGVAQAKGVPVLSEFDLARWWDSRPIAAITGTDGKTSVTMLTVAMLEASGIRAAAVGNTETPLVEAIDHPDFDVFVVEASSFRLGHSQRFSPTVGAWLNFAPDHLDVHESLEGYEAAKSKIWHALPEHGLAIAPADDPIVLRHLPANRRSLIVGMVADGRATAFLDEDRLLIDGVEIASISDLPRALDHDITNTLVAAGITLHLGGTVAGIRSALATHELPPHRIQFVATSEGVSFYNDSKATVPHAVLAAVRGFESVVLIAGGRNKGLDLSGLRAIADRTRAVVAMGDAATEVARAFDGVTPVEIVTDMDHAVRVAMSLAKVGDAVLLSPGCTSFDAYPNYGARGDDFIRAVRELVEAS